MERFLIFAGRDNVEGVGGWEDLIDSTAEIAEALDLARRQAVVVGEWAHVVDLETGEIEYSYEGAEATGEEEDVSAAS